MESKHSYSFTTKKALESLISSYCPGILEKFLHSVNNLRRWQYAIPTITSFMFDYGILYATARHFNKAMKISEQVLTFVLWKPCNQWVVFKKYTEEKEF